MTAIRRFALPIVVVAALALTPACAKKYQAEKDGKDVGEAACDVRDAEPGSVDDALKDLKGELDDIDENYAVFTAEDRADIDEQFSDLAEHVKDGNEALINQDIAVIQRSLDNIKDDMSDTARATVDGFFEGLDDCVNG